MTFIDETTSRKDLLSAIYGDINIVQYFIDKDADPETMETADIYEALRGWVEAGDECSGA
jgi:hypothetical protein